MSKIKKFIVIKILEIFKERGCITIDDVIELLNRKLKKDE